MVEQPSTRTYLAEQQRASSVIAVVLRVAGPVITDIRPDALGTRERQVCVRIGDVLVYLTDYRVAALIRRHWDAAQHLVLQRLPERVPQAWLAQDTGNYPVGVCVHLTRGIELRNRFERAHRDTSCPPHWRVQVGRLLWQVCYQHAWRVIGEAWFAAQRHLDRE